MTKCQYRHPHAKYQLGPAPEALDRLPATLAFSNYSALLAVCRAGSLNASFRSGIPRRRHLQFWNPCPGSSPHGLSRFPSKSKRHRTGKALSNAPRHLTILNNSRTFFEVRIFPHSCSGYKGRWPRSQGFLHSRQNRALGSESIFSLLILLPIFLRLFRPLPSFPTRSREGLVFKGQGVDLDHFDVPRGVKGGVSHEVSQHTAWCTTPGWNCAMGPVLTAGSAVPRGLNKSGEQ
jgi:hypothetical protein